MQIWSAEIKELESLNTSIKGRFPELEKDLEHLIKTDDENVALLYSRRCLEIIVTDLCESELKRPRKTEPLKGIIDKLHREEKVPSHIITSMESLNSLSTYGTHPKEFDPEQVRPILLNLATIIKWYVKYKDAQIVSKQTAGAVKDETEAPTSGDSTEHIQKSKKRLIFLIIGILMIVVIIVIALFVFNIIGGGKQTKELEKSIAVLPFKSLSADPEKQYLADGMMEAILLHLSKIEDLRVMSRTSVEQYRNTDKTSGVIGYELGVAYLLEGSFQKYGDDARLIVQLIKTGKEGHEWANQYDRKWDDIFSIQSEVAQAIANELKAIITPEEKQLIEKTPTTSLTAYDFYQRGKEEERKYSPTDPSTKQALDKAEKLYMTALEYDSTFSQAYTGLAYIYINKHIWGEEYFSESFLDSILILADISLNYNDQLDEAYIYRGYYYWLKGLSEKANKEFDKALKFNPNSWMAYYTKGNLFFDDDIVKIIENFQKAASLNHGSELPDILRNIAGGYMLAGFLEKAKYYSLEAYKLDGDSVKYQFQLGGFENCFGNYEKSIEYLKKGYKLDSTNSDILKILGDSYMYIGQFEESLKYYKKWISLLKARGVLDLNNMHRIGYVYWKNGFKKEADDCFNYQLDYCNNLIKSNRPQAQSLWAYYDRAGVNAFRGDKEKAYEDLRIFNQRPKFPKWGAIMIKDDPLFDSIRDEPEFQQIVRDVEAKYQAEHERVRKWLEEQGEI